MTNVITAAGGLVWRNPPEKETLAVIHRPRYDDWTLPKGKVKQGEDWEVAATREVEEETGCGVRLGDFVGCLSYQVKSRPKVVLFWHMYPIGKCEFKPSSEVDQMLWLSVQDALKRLDYSTERNFLRSITNLPQSFTGTHHRKPE